MFDSLKKFLQKDFSAKVFGFDLSLEDRKSWQMRIHAQILNLHRHASIRTELKLSPIDLSQLKKRSVLI